MLNKELLKTIEGLTDEQIGKIEELSKNDENSVIAAKLREVHDRYDADIKQVTGIDKPLTEKSYDFMKRVLSEYKTQGEAPNELQGQIEELKAQNKELTAKMKDGASDDVLKQKLTDSETLISKLREDLRNQQKTHEQSLLEKEHELSNFKLTSIQDASDRDLVFKSDLDKKTLSYHKQGARQEAMQTGKPEIADVDGRTAIIFRDENGQIITDDNNLRKPLTYADRYKSLLSPVLDVSSTISGTGAKGVNGKPLLGGGNWSTKVEATKAISKELIENGYSVGTSEYESKLTEMYQAHNVKDLPLR